MNPCHGPRAIDLGLMSCHICGLVVRAAPGHAARCPRCRSPLHSRKPDSIARTWALLLTAILMYVPANALPVMNTISLGRSDPATILDGVVYFLTHGEWPLAVIIFAASVLVPLFKMLALGFLLITVQRRSRTRRRQRTQLYRIAEFLGRWSMLDVFVVTLMTALIQLDALASIEPGLGIMAFASVVILTMLAAQSFDPRLIWDHQQRTVQHER